LGEVISLSQFVFTLLHTNTNLSGDDSNTSFMPVVYILNLISNSIDSLFQIIDIILDGGCACSNIDIQRHHFFIEIGKSWPSLINYIISECIRRHCLTSVVLHLSLLNNNLIPTLLSIFQFEHDRNWFVQFLRSPNKNAIEKQSVDIIREHLVASCYNNKQNEFSDLNIFKLYSGLRIFAGLKFNESEVKALINLILSTNEISVAACFLLIYPPLFESLDNYQSITKWLRSKFFEAQQSILLIAIYCNSHQLQHLNDYASNIIGFKFPLKTTSLHSMSKIFKEVFPDDTLITEYMKSLPIIKGLNSDRLINDQQQSSTAASSLGIYFLNQWIKSSNSFSNIRSLSLDIWLTDQIKECTEPLHPIMISLINNYVTQLFNSSVKNENNRLLILAPDTILKFLKDNFDDYDCNLSSKILFFYYLLIYETKRRETLIQTLSSGASSSNKIDKLLTFRYSTEIFDYIPINYLLLKAKEPQFRIIYPSLLHQVINMFTQLCQVEHSLSLYSSTVDLTKAKSNNIEYIITAIDNLKQQTITNQTTRDGAKMIKKLWFKGYSIHGRKLSLQTASLILNEPKLKYEQIYANPLLLLKSNDIQLYK
jgi:hypothetical protein